MTDTPAPRRIAPDRVGGAAAVVVAAMLFVPKLIAPPPPDDWDYAPAAAIGFAGACLCRTGYRALGLVPVAAIVVLATTVVGDTPATLLVRAGASGLLVGALVRYVARNGGRNLPTFRLGTSDWLLLAGFLFGAIAFRTGAPAAWDAPSVALAALGFGAAFASVRLFRPFFELSVEPFVALMYRIRGVGPGANAVPYGGPLLVVANHACFLDPLFLAQLLPRPITPMMTSLFFDVWFLKPLMVHVFGTIRVPDERIRRTAPELGEAIAALDAGKCVVIFPEAYLRRKEEQPLRRFGRGAFEILKARPATPVMACWIEGGWGSFFSHRGGPPGKNKRPDFRRRIRVAMGPVGPVPAAWLGDHMTLRLGLMDEVAATRAHLGLPALPPFAVGEPH